MKCVDIATAVVLSLALAISVTAQEQAPDSSREQLPTSSASGSEGAPSDQEPIVPGKLLNGILPKYPKEARKAKIEGQVEVTATIEPDGGVSSVSIVNGDIKLAEAAVDAVQDWRFEPYSQGGRPVQVLQTILLDFSRDKKTAALQPLSAPVLGPRQPQNLQTRGGGVFRVGGGVSAPKAIYAPDPKYSDKARKGKYQGVCVLSLIVTPEGTPRNIKIARAIGRGLDEKAIEAVSKWKFEPAMKDGKPVAVAINIEITFRLY